MNSLGLPDKKRYRTTDACALLGISADLFRWRIRTGKYPDSEFKDAKGRIFAFHELQKLYDIKHQNQLKGEKL